MTVQFRFFRKGELIGYYFRIRQNQFIEVFARDSKPHSGDLTIGHFCLEVGDLKPVRETLMAHGVEVTEPKLGADHSRQMWCSDPDGALIEFHQYTAESMQTQGGDCHVDW